MKPPIKPLQRLIGLETEYAIRFRDAASPRTGITHRDVYRETVDSLRSLLPTAPSDFVRAGKEGVFAANGMAVWFERCRFHGEPGLIEGCTPECRGPRQVLACQRALDRLLGQAVRSEEFLYEAALLKNCRDPRGESYGAQENYEVDFASGWRMLIWKCGVVALIPVSIVTFMLLFAILLSFAVLNSLVAAPIYRILLRSRRGQDETRLRNTIFGGAWFEGGEHEAPYPAWIETPMVWLMRILVIPQAVSISALSCVTRLRRTQRLLLPFLISRMVFTGAGWLDTQGRFQVSDKATSRMREFFLFLVDHDRPIYSLGNLFKLVLWFAVFPARSGGVFRARQRLQISIGDSNLCEEAEYLKIATTALVIDAIEAGALEQVPRFRRPVRMLHRLSGDPELKLRVRTSMGEMSAIEIQRHYLAGCRDYLQQSAEAPDEAYEILDRWSEVLDKLEHDRESLVGRIDWITKRHLLTEAGDVTDPAARRKIDLKYHELSEDGYHNRLEAAGHTARILDDETIERATRTPPSVNPAATRCRYIREFSNDGDLKWVSWDALQLGPDYGSKLVHFDADTTADVEAAV